MSKTQTRRSYTKPSHIGKQCEQCDIIIGHTGGCSHVNITQDPSEHVFCTPRCKGAWSRGEKKIDWEKLKKKRRGT